MSNTVAVREISEGQRIRQETFALDLQIRGISFVRKEPAVNILKDEDKCRADRFGVTKRLIDRADLKAITTLDNEFKRWLNLRRVECRILRSGMYLIPLALAADVEEALTAYKNARASEVERFVERYNELRDAAARQLGEHYDPSDYPTVDLIRSRFVVISRYLTLNVPAALAEVNQEIYDRERQKAELEWGRAVDEIREALRASFADLVNWMAVQLTPTDDGKKRMISVSKVEELNTFLATFEARDLTRDADLQVLAQQARQLMNGVDVITLRKNQDVKASIQAGFAEIQKQTAEWIVKQPSRSFNFDE